MRAARALVDGSARSLCPPLPVFCSSRARSVFSSPSLSLALTPLLFGTSLPAVFPLLSFLDPTASPSLPPSFSLLLSLSALSATLGERLC
mmetsp:Transcript_5862/g.16475  ORF Transcript_5862/g.16475 Transcript_5862/m.16475 type:complete len:90 (+) Transcript_5862:3056-3325(+)